MQKGKIVREEQVVAQRERLNIFLYRLLHVKLQYTYIYYVFVVENLIFLFAKKILDNLIFLCFLEHPHQHPDQEHIQRPQSQGQKNDQDHAAQVWDEEAEAAADDPAATHRSGQGGGALARHCAAAGQDSV